MKISGLVTLLLYMVICSFTPGPGNILALNTTGRYGWKKSRILILGICAGYAVVQTICTVALCVLNQKFSFALDVLRFFGGFYMLSLAWDIIKSTPAMDSEEKPPKFREGFLLQLVNVKIYLYIITLLSSYYIPHFKSAFGLAAAGVFTVCLGSTATLLWAFLGSRFQNLYIKYYKPVNIVLGAVLAGCAVKILLG